MKFFIKCKLDVEGMHRWEDAASECPRSGYLEHDHRHMFRIVAEKKIDPKSEEDRAIEFIALKQDIVKFLRREYYSDSLGMMNFNNMSCEGIALCIFNEFDLDKCAVFEDDENGGGVEKD